MQKEPPDNSMAENESATVPAGAIADGIPTPHEETPEEIAQPDDEQTSAKVDNGDDNLTDKEPLAEAGTGRVENRVEQVLNGTSAEILNGVSGNNNRISNHYHSHSD